MIGEVACRREDQGADACLHKCVELADLSKPMPKYTAFVFIMPHAVTDKVKDLARAGS